MKLGVGALPRRKLVGGVRMKLVVEKDEGS